MKIAMLTTDSREHFRDHANPQPYFGTAPEALLQGFAMLPEVEVHVVSCTQRPMHSPVQLAGNIYFHSLPVPKIGWLRTGYQGCIRATRAKLREIRPEIVHGQGTERDCALSAVFSGFRNVITIHGNMRLVAGINHARSFSFQWIAARLEKLTLPRTDGVVCITRYTQQAVAELARRTWLVPNAVDASFFEIVPQPERVPLLLCAGTICLRKNQNAFIESLDELAGRLRFRLLFLGSGGEGDPYFEKFRTLVAARPWCEFTGFASRDVLRGWMRRASLLALPSLEDNCPMTVLEAAAAGVPVMAANVGGVPDLVVDGVTGVLCDPTESSSMREGVERLLTQEPWAQQIATKAREEAQRRFHPRVIAAEHVRIYRELLDRSPKTLA